MNKRAVAFVLSLLFLLPISYFSTIKLSADDDFDKISTLTEAILAIEKANKDYYDAETWANLQLALNDAKTLNRYEGYFAIKADVDPGHFNQDRYLSRIGSNANSFGVLRYKGHGATAGEKSAFDDDQVWLKVYTDDTYTTFTLRNKNNNALLYASDAYSDGRLVKNTATSVTGQVANLILKNGDGTGSFELGVVDQTINNVAITNHIVDFTRKTHEYADTASSRPTNLLLFRPANKITGKSKCIFEPLPEYNTELDAQKAAKVQYIISLLSNKLDIPESTDEITTLKEAITFAGLAKEADYDPETWAILQETIAKAKELDLQEGQFAIKAVVDPGHINENRYITMYGGHWDTYATLRYRGKGSTATSNPNFTNDQIWIKVGVEGKPGVFTLKNLAKDADLYAGAGYAGGYILCCGGVPTSVERTYFYIKKIDDSNQMLGLMDQSGITDQVVNFTKKTDHVPDTNPVPRLDNYFYTSPSGSIGGKSNVEFERLDNSFNKELDKSKEEMLLTLIGLLRRRKNTPLNDLSSLYNSIIENDCSLNYTPADYEELQKQLVLAEAVLKGQAYYIVQNNNAAYADSDGYVKYQPLDTNNEKQVWLKISQDNGYFQLLSSSTGTYMYHSDEQNAIFNNVADFGFYIKHARKNEIVDNPNRLLFRNDNRSNLQPVYNSSTMTESVSVVYKETGGEKKLYADAGLTNSKKVEFMLIYQDSLYYAAGRVYEALQSIYSSRDNTVHVYNADEIKALVEQGRSYEEGSSDVYAQRTLAALKNAIDAANSILDKIELSEAVAQGQMNLIGYSLKTAIEGLKLKNAKADADYKKALEDLIAEVTAEKDLKDKNGAKVYYAPCIEAAEKKLSSAKSVLNKTNVTYGELDDATDSVLDAKAKLVLESVYFSLLREVENVRNRNPEDYQPKTWNAILDVFKKSEKATENITEYTNQEILALTDEITLVTNKLVKRADTTVLTSIVNLIANLQLKEANFTPDTWRAFSQTFETAKSLLKDYDVQQASVDTITFELILVTNGLKYVNSDAGIGLFPNINIGYPQNARDRYKEGYELGTKWGSYDAYNEGYSKGYTEGYEYGKSLDPKVTRNTEYVNEDPETVTVEPVQEVKQVTTKTEETVYEKIRIPELLILLAIVLVPVMLAGGVFLGFKVQKKKAAKLSQ